MIEQDEIKNLNKRLDIVKFLETLGAYNVHQIRNELNYRCPCFFRDGDNPNGMGIFFDEAKSKWLCTDFTHKTFSNIDLIDLAVKHCDTPFIKTIQILRDCILKDSDVLSRGKVFRSVGANSERIRHIPEEILNCFSEGLHPYLHKRGYLPQTAKHFQLGFCCIGELQDRVTIPIRDKEGKLVSIQGRTTINEYPKYLFYDGTGDVAKQVLYNLDKAFEDIREKGYVIVVEGCPSVWRMWQYGIKNVVATLSTSITNSQINLLISLNVKIIFFFDFDDNNAGQISTIRGVKMLKEKNFKQGVYTTNIGKLGLTGSPDDIDANSVVEALYNIKRLL